MLNVLITCDLDPDRNGNWEAFDLLKSHWTRRSIPLQDKPHSFFVRSDLELSGGPLEFLDKEASWLESLLPDHCVGWHPHFKIADFESSVRCQDAIAELGLSFPYHRICRVGLSHGGTNVDKLLVRANMAADSSALPGKKGGSYDWSSTPARPFVQKVTDIAKPATYLQIPLSTSQFSTERDQNPRFRFLNPCYPPEVFQLALNNWVPVDHLILLFHPEDLFGAPKKTGLTVGGVENYQANCDQLMDFLSNYEHRFCHLKEYADFIG